MVFRGGAIYTVDAARSWASAVAIENGRIVAVGTDAQIAAHIGRGTRVIELNGRMMLPGFHDSHMHPLSGGLRLVRCRLNDAKSKKALHVAIRTCAAAASDTWLVGGGWDPDVIPAQTLDRATLDRLVPDRPAYFATYDGFSAWVNSRALAVAGITASTPDPDGGTIERDPVTGEPSGVLHRAATSLVRRHIPPPGDALYREGLRRSLAMANRFGITSVIDASASPELLVQYQNAERDGELTVRVLASQRVDAQGGIEQAQEMLARSERFEGKRLRANAAKIFVDGDFTTRSAALLAPHVDDGSRGRMRISSDALAAIVTRLDAVGFQVHMHVIGDRAVRAGLDAIARAHRVNGRLAQRHQLAHLTLIDPADIPRFRRLGVAANFQPMWAYADEIVTHTEALLGPERSRWLYPIASMVNSGAVVVAGSDWPSPSMNPLEAIQVAMTRRPLKGDGSAWLPQERITLPAILAAYTINGAWLKGEEANTGSIEVGKAADLIVLNRNLFDIDPMAVQHVKVLLTLLEGETVYRNPAFPLP